MGTGTARAGFGDQQHATYWQNIDPATWPRNMRHLALPQTLQVEHMALLVPKVERRVRRRHHAATFALADHLPVRYRLTRGKLVGHRLK